jgi:hypothetical protein
MTSKNDDSSNSPHNNKNGFLEVNVIGNDEDVWSRFKSKFLSHLNQLLEMDINPNSNATLRDEIADYSESILGAGKEILRRPRVKNAEIEADVVRKYAEAEKIRAEARKTNAEASEIEERIRLNRFNASIQKLKLMMNLGAVIVQNQPKKEKEEFIVFIKNIQPLLNQSFQDDGPIKMLVDETAKE